MTINMMFNKTYEVLRSEKTLTGGVTTESESVSSEVKGLLVPVAGFESFRYMKITAETTDRLYCSHSADILKTDRIREKGTSQKFEVIEPPRVSTLGANKHMEVELKRIDP